jgi:hypothetical protein
LAIDTQLNADARGVATGGHPFGYVGIA